MPTPHARNHTNLELEEHQRPYPCHQMLETEKINQELRNEIQALRLHRESLESEVAELRLDKRTLEVSVANMKKMFEDEIEETQYSLEVAANRCAMLWVCT